MNILITGGAGFIGSSLALRLLELGHKVTIVDNLSPQIHTTNPSANSYTFNLISGKVNFFNCDIADVSVYKSILPEVDVLFHLASETGTGQSMYSLSSYYSVNCLGFIALLETILECNHKIQNLILTSSRSVYGEGKYFCADHGFRFPSGRVHASAEAGYDCLCDICGNVVSPSPTDECSVLNPLSIYASTKLSQEHIANAFTASTGIKSTVLRFQNVYGPGQSLFNPYTGILSIFTSLIKSDSQITIFEDGLESRDFVFISDVVECLIACLNKPPSNDFDVYNVGTGIPISVLEVVKNISSFFCKEPDYIIPGIVRSGDIRHNFADMSKFNSFHGFKPTVPFQTGLFDFLNWAASFAIDNSSSYDESLNVLRTKGLLK